jgi:hypothetical protein
MSLIMPMVISRRDVLSGGDAVAGIAKMNSVVASTVGFLSQDGGRESSGDKGSKANHGITRVSARENGSNG